MGLAPLEKCVGHSFKLFYIVEKFGPLSENSSPHWCPKVVTGLLLIRKHMKTNAFFPICIKVVQLSLTSDFFRKLLF